MNNIKFVYYNFNTTNWGTLINTLKNSSSYSSHIDIQPGLCLINFHGSARDLFEVIENLVIGDSILIYDLDNSKDAFWGLMHKSVWEWIKQNADYK